ncbi:hypothetical protein TEA_011258 [Camellia sinensis var. sinensis]|uniref:SAM domain-containing protein n=1 Tax=Camellia sinensis var. sinensis TaxID=542762 RepID=A0A4S4D4T1_CAMSN|nr:hypothetical protein TEA_011258 [Camellia sinensis var. sinensis]
MRYKPECGCLLKVFLVLPVVYCWSLFVCFLVVVGLPFGVRLTENRNCVVLDIKNGFRKSSIKDRLYGNTAPDPTRPRQSIKDRLYGNTAPDPTRPRQITGKRLRQDDDKWEHDLYKDDEHQVSNRRVGTKDLRLKLQKKSVQQATKSGNGSVSGARDLREKLSGTMYSHPANTDLPKLKPVLEGSKPVRKSVIAESVDSFLQSLGLEKYSITFQAEEVDMTALVHMNDEDLKVLGIPMGPRKKILLALESRA